MPKSKEAGPALEKWGALAACVAVIGASVFAAANSAGDKPVQQIQMAAPAAQTPIGMRKFMNCSGRRYAFLENGASYQLEPDQIGEELGKLEHDMQLDPQNNSQKDFSATFAVGGTVYRMTGYDDDYKELNGFDFMEIYNHGCEIDGLYGWNPQSYDEVLRTGRHLGCFATDDNHNFAPFGDPYCDSFGGFTMLKMEELTYEEVINAMKNGNYYASTGPEIHSLVLKDGAVHVKCSPCEKIYMITEGRHTQLVMVKNGKLEEEAVFPLDGKEGYIRIECRDNKGGRACSRAYFLTEFED